MGPTLSCLVAPPCTPALLIACKRRSLPWLHPPLRSRSLLPLRGNTLYGSVAPSWLLFPPSNRCGSPSKSMMNAAHPLSTGSASKCFIFTFYHLQLVMHLFFSHFFIMYAVTFQIIHTSC